MTRLFILILGILGALTLTAPAMAAEPGWTVSDVSGPVAIVVGERRMAAKRGVALRPGWAVETGRSARAVLVRGKEFVTVAPGSRIVVPAAKDDGVIQIVMDWGRALFQIEKKATPHFGVRTPVLAAVVKGTTFRVTADANGSKVEVLEGLVEVSDKDGSERQLIPANRRAEVLASDPGRIQVADGVAPESAPPAPGTPPIPTIPSGTAPTTPTSATMPILQAPAPVTTTRTSFVIEEEVVNDSQLLATLTSGLVRGDTGGDTMVRAARERVAVDAANDAKAVVAGIVPVTSALEVDTTRTSPPEADATPRPGPVDAGSTPNAPQSAAPSKGDPAPVPEGRPQDPSKMEEPTAASNDGAKQAEKDRADQKAADDAKADQEKADKLKADKAADDAKAAKDAADKQAVDKDEAEKDKAEKDKAEKDRADQKAADDAKADQAKADKLKADRAADDAKAAKDAADKQAGEKDKAEKDKAEKDRADQKAADDAKADQEKADKLKADKAADNAKAAKDAADKQAVDKDKAEKEKAEKDRADKDKMDKEKSDQAKADKDREEKEKNDKEKADKDKAEKEKADKLSAEKEKADKKVAEDVKAALEKAEKEREKVEKEKAEKEKVEKDRADKEKADKDKEKGDKNKNNGKAGVVDLLDELTSPLLDKIGRNDKPR